MPQKEEFIIKLKDLYSSPLRRAAKNTDVMRSKVGGLQSQIGGLKLALAGVFTGFAVRGAINDIIKVGSTFEQLQISFETMLGSGEKATALIKDLTKFGVETPFELQDVAKGAKSLLAFNIAQEKIIPTLKALGDVSAGLSVPIERLILNYGQVRAQQKLTGRELRDFAIAGVPILDELANMLGKNTTEIQDLVSKGRIGFPIVEQAFKNMSSEGGTFFNLMQRQTASTGGQISNLTDVVDLLRNDLFVKFQPVINGVVKSIQDWTAFLRKNIDQVVRAIRIVGRLIKVFLIYKTLLFAVNGLMAAGRVAVVAYRIAMVAMSRGVFVAIRSLKAFRAALISTGIGAAIFALSLLIEKYLNLESAITGVNEAESERQKANERLKSLGDEVRETKKLFAIRKTLDNTALMRLRERLKEQTTAAQTEIGLAKLEVEKKGPRTPIEVFGAQQDLRDAQKRLKGIRQRLSAITEIAKRRGLDITADFTAGGKKTDLKSGISEVRAGAPKVFNINIESLVEKFSVETQNMSESPARVKEMITKVLLTALNDVQVLSR